MHRIQSTPITITAAAAALLAATAAAAPPQGGAPSAAPPRAHQAPPITHPAPRPAAAGPSLERRLREHILDLKRQGPPEPGCLYG